MAFIQLHLLSFVVTAVFGNIQSENFIKLTSPNIQFQKLNLNYTKVSLITCGAFCVEEKCCSFIFKKNESHCELGSLPLVSGKATDMNIDIFCRNSNDCICDMSPTVQKYNCNGTLNVTDNYYGEIISPNYPLNYPNNANCFWNFTTAVGWIFRLTFKDFNVEEPFDYVQVYDGMELVAKFLNSTVRLISNTSSNALTVQFFSGTIKTFKGFKASYNVAIK